MERLDLEFYYGQEAEQFTFYRLPKALITDNRFKEVSNNAKLLYGLMLDRMGLSARSGWFDEENRVYIKYAVKSCGRTLKRASGNRTYRYGSEKWTCQYYLCEEFCF